MGNDDNDEIYRDVKMYLLSLFFVYSFLLNVMEDIYIHVDFKVYIVRFL